MVDQAITRPPEAATPAGKWLPALGLAWLIPGAGHFMLRRRARGALVFASVILMFLLGLMMRGPLFEPQGGDMLTMLIYYGGYLAHIATGIPYIQNKARDALQKYIYTKMRRRPMVMSFVVEV